MKPQVDSHFFSQHFEEIISLNSGISCFCSFNCHSSVGSLSFTLFFNINTSLPLLLEGLPTRFADGEFGGLPGFAFPFSFFFFSGWLHFIYLLLKFLFSFLFFFILL